MRSLVVAFAMILGLTAATVQAGAPMPFDAQAFAAAQAENKPILVDIHADWCPICARQQPILSSLENSPELKDLVVFDVDFDSQKDVVRRFGAYMQSTLIVFKGKADKGRSTGETDPAAIKALLMKAKTS